MKLFKPMRWKEGMFLRPQHFQQYDLYLEAREKGRFHAAESYGWGILRMEIDEAALDNHVFKLNSLRAVLPNGTLVDYPGSAQLHGRSFDGLMREVGQPMDVHIGLRAHEDRGPQVPTEGGSAGDTRYLPAEEEVYDLDAGRDPVPLEKLVYNLRIFMGDESTEGYETLPVARLTLTGDSGRPVQLEPSFSAPALVLAASPVLHGAARAVVEQLSLTLRSVGQKRGGNDPDPLILYYGLSGSMPVLKDMVVEGQVHTRRVYHEMARLAGALFYRDKQGRSAEEIPAYDHRDPGPVFQRLRKLIVELCGEIIPDQYRRVPMERTEESFTASLPAEVKQSGARFFLEVLAEDSAPKVRMLMMASKVSNPDRIQFLRDNALPGVPTELHPSPPEGLPRGQKGTFFRLVNEHDEWATHVVPAGRMTVFTLGAPTDVKINLIVLLAGA